MPSLSTTIEDMANKPYCIALQRCPPPPCESVQHPHPPNKSQTSVVVLAPPPQVARFPPKAINTTERESHLFRVLKSQPFRWQAHFRAPLETQSSTWQNRTAAPKEVTTLAGQETNLCATYKLGYSKSAQTMHIKLLPCTKRSSFMAVDVWPPGRNTPNAAITERLGTSPWTCATDSGGFRAP